MDYFKDKLYRCFNQDLKWHLLNNGCHFLIIASDCSSGDKFWLFERTEQFNKLLHKRKLYDRYKKYISYVKGYQYLEIPYWTDDKNESYKKLIDDKIAEILEINKEVA